MKLLITGAWNYSDKDIQSLESIGYNCIFHKNENVPLPVDFLDVDGIVCNGLFIYSDANLFRNLKFVQLTSAGMDRIPLEYLKEKGIKIFNASGVYSIPIAEFVVSSILDLYKQKFIFYENQKKHIWEKQRSLLELNGKMVCIVGCGNVGKECAKRFKAFGCSVFGIDLFSFKNNYFNYIVSIDEMMSHINKADIVVLTLPLTDETKHLFNISIFRQMKNTSLLVNVSRGGVVDTHDLELALKEGLIKAAVLDVFESEPLDFQSHLWDIKNLFISPHNSFISENNDDRLSQLIIANLKEII